MVRAIIFDYGNVIARFDHAIFFNRIAKYSPLSVDELRAVASRQRQLLVAYESGRLRSDDFYKQVVEACSLSITREEFLDAFNLIFQRIPATIQLIRQLKPQYKLALLSNTNEWHFKAEIATLEVFPLFDAVTLSFEVGAMKPSALLFDDVIAKLRLAPPECIYIDDVPEYVEAAHKSGFRTIRYTSHESLITSLLAEGVTV
jgi:epoxide hydrolase-like predicted phosphatase